MGIEVIEIKESKKNKIKFVDEERKGKIVRNLVDGRILKFI